MNIYSAAAQSAIFRLVLGFSLELASIFEEKRECSGSQEREIEYRASKSTNGVKGRA